MRAYSGHQGQGRLSCLTLCLPFGCTLTSNQPLTDPLKTLCILGRPSQWPHQSLTPAARQQVHPFSLVDAALFSFCLLLYIDMLLPFSCSTLLVLYSHHQSSQWFWSVYGCQTWQMTVFLHVAAKHINIIEGKFLYLHLTFTCSTPHLPTTPSTLSSCLAPKFLERQKVLGRVKVLWSCCINILKSTFCQLKVNVTLCSFITAAHKIQVSHTIHIH